MGDSFYSARIIEADNIYVHGINTVLSGPDGASQSRGKHFIGPSRYDMEITGQVLLLTIAPSPSTAASAEFRWIPA